MNTGKKLILFSVFALLSATVRAEESEPHFTASFIITTLRTAIHDTPYLDECPKGVAIGSDQIWWKGLSPPDRDRLTGGGQKEAASRSPMANFRGPHGEDICWNPTVVTDPPLRTIEGHLGYGLNLDGTQDGRPTPDSCSHEKFQDPESGAPVDNQMARLVGCIQGWRPGGYIEAVSDTERLASSEGVTLIEISGTGDLKNASNVRVQFFRAADPFPKDSQGGVLPYGSYRTGVDQRYGATAQGRIVDGILTTEPVDARLPFYGNRVETEFDFRALRLRAKISDDKAEGLLAGYQDLDNWWDYTRKMGYLQETAQFDCPALYVAAHRLADGYPDASGQCTALSTAYKFSAVRAFIVSGTRESGFMGIATDNGASNAALPAGIGRQMTPLGEVLAARGGFTLYYPTDGCRKDCDPDFEPLPAPVAAVPSAGWTVVKMEDGSTQWARMNQPLFTCRRDFKPGVALCADAHWRLIIVQPRPALPNWITTQPSELGPILADADGRTLYSFIGDMAQFNKQICGPECMALHWKAVAAGPDAKAVGDWAPADLPQGRIWTVRQRPVYIYLDDQGPGAIAGHRFGGASVSVKNWFSAIKRDDFTISTAGN
jgi:predicted lipoprotein with Yx(FWY)xxD motif